MRGIGEGGAGPGGLSVSAAAGSNDGAGVGWCQAEVDPATGYRPVLPTFRSGPGPAGRRACGGWACRSPRFAASGPRPGWTPEAVRGSGSPTISAAWKTAWPTAKA